MSIIAEFTIPPAALPGGDLLGQLPGIHLELERIVPTEEQALPFFWVIGDSVDTFVANIEDEPEIAELTVLDHLDQGALVRVSWEPDAEVLEAVKTLDATMLEAVGSSKDW